MLILLPFPECSFDAKLSLNCLNWRVFAERNLFKSKSRQKYEIFWYINFFRKTLNRIICNNGGSL